jgi:hypothetical protein
MSLRRKRPGKFWVTGIPRAQLRKINLLLSSLIAQQGKLAPAVVPITPQMIGDFNQVKVDIQALLLVLS